MYSTYIWTYLYIPLDLGSLFDNCPLPASRPLRTAAPLTEEARQSDREQRAREGPAAFPVRAYGCE
jgi:hypothetical protein